MIHETISNVAAVLRDLRNHVGSEEAEVLRQASIVLESAAEQAANFENLLPIAGTGEQRNETPAAA